MGWLGWTPATCLSTDVNLIEMALAGRADLMQMAGLVKLPRKPGDRRVSAADWAQFKKRHNMRYRLYEAEKRKERSSGDGGS